MNDKLKTLYENLIKDNYELPSYDIFVTDMSDEVKSKTLHDTLVKDNYDVPDYDTFTTDLDIKKKVPTISLEGLAAGESVSQMLGTAPKEPLIQPQPLPSAKEPQQPQQPEERKTTVVGDLLRSLKSGSLRAAGGISGIPQFVDKTISRLTVRPLMRAFGKTPEEADQLIDAISHFTTEGQLMALGGEAQKKLNKMAAKTEAKIAPIEGNIVQNIKEGDWGSAGELLGRGVVQSIPYLALTAATAGGGTAATLGTIGATAASQQYGELEGAPESQRVLNSWLYGGFEAAGELATAGLLRGVGKAFKAGVAGEVNKDLIKGAAKEIAKGFGLESSSEAVTQVGQNLTDIITGVNPDKHILDNVLDAGLIGGFSGTAIGGVNIGASVLGRAMASDKEVEQVQNNAKQQEVLINQIDETESDPVKRALTKSVKDLQSQSGEIMDANRDVAAKLTEAQQNQVSELFSVANDIQEKIDNKQITEDERPTMEAAVKGIKDQIQQIKESVIAEEEAKAKEAEAKKPVTEEPPAKEQLKIGEQEFTSKQELFDFLDKKGDIYVSSEMGILNPETNKAMDEWNKSRRIQKAASGLNDITFIGQQRGIENEPVLDLYNVDINGQRATFGVPVQGNQTDGEYNDTVVQKKAETIARFQQATQEKKAEVPLISKEEHISSQEKQMNAPAYKKVKRDETTPYHLINFNTIDNIISSSTSEANKRGISVVSTAFYDSIAAKIAQESKGVINKRFIRLPFVIKDYIETRRSVTNAINGGMDDATIVKTMALGGRPVEYVENIITKVRTEQTTPTPTIEETTPITEIGGQENAESRRESTENGSQQAQGLEQGEEERIRLRDNEEARVETVTGEEVAPQPQQAPKEAISAPISEKTGEWPPIPQKPVETTKNKPTVVTGIEDLVQKASFDCGSCALRTVLGKYGIKESEQSLIDQTKPTKEDGTQISAIVNVAKEKGLSVKTQENMTPDDLRKNIDNDIPVIILQNGIGETESGKDYSGVDKGHYITIKGYSGDKFIFEDPAAKSGDLTMTEQELLDRWHGKRDNGKGIASGQGIVIKPPKGGVETQEKEGKDQTREKGYFTQLHKSSVPSKELKDEIEESGLNYKVLNNNVTKENVDYVISQLGLDEAWRQVKDLNNGINGATRNGIAQRVVYHYDKLAEKARGEEDWESATGYLKTSFEAADWIDTVGRDFGRFNQYTGSDETTKLLLPESRVARTKGQIRKQRDKKVTQHKEDIKEQRDEIRKANKESVDEVVKSEEYKKLKDKIAQLEKQLEEKDVPPKAPKEYKDKIKKEQAYIKDQWAKFKQAGKTSASATIAGLNSEQVEAIGNIIAAYVRMGVYKTEDIIKRLKKDWFKNTGTILEQKDAEALLPKEVDGKSLADIEEEGTAKSLADKLTERVKRMLEDPKTAKDNPVKQLLDALYQKIQEKDTKEKVKPEKKPTIAVIREAVENREDYADVWDAAKEKVIFMINSNEELSEEQKSEYLKRLNSFFDEVIGKPYSETQTERAVREEIKEQEIDVDKVIRQHYTVQDAIGRSLAEKLIEKAGMTEEDANLFAEAVQKQFSKIATNKKRSILLRGMKARVQAKLNPKKAKQTWEKAIELTNLGAFSSAEFSEFYADAMGFPTLTEENINEMMRLAERIDKREGYRKDEAVQDYLNYIAKLPGLDLGDVALGVWYANILSGYRTQSKNGIGSLVNTIFETSTSIAYNVAKGDFKTSMFMAKALFTWSTLQQAVNEAAYTFNTGYSPFRQGKIEAANYMERWQFKGDKYNPFNYVKYVGRFMSATDVFFYAGLRETRAHELAMREAQNRDAEAETPSISDWAKATEILYGTQERKAEAEIKADEEGLTGSARNKRVWELIEQSRGAGIITESNNFATRGTYNYKPEGTLGMLTESIARLAESGKAYVKNPFTGATYTVRFGKLIVPFTRIIANVGNTAMEYTPIGYYRAAKGSMMSNPESTYYRKFTAEERGKLALKASLGTITAISVFFLSEPPDDDSEPFIQITARGTGDYAKNKELKASPNGWEQYSIKIGGTWFSYQYTPLFLLLAPIGFIRDTQKYKKDKASTMKALDIAGSAAWTFLSALSDMTAISSAAGFMEAISSGDVTSFSNYWKKLASSSTKGFIYPKAIEQIQQAIDDSYDNPLRYSSSTLGKIVKDMPVIRNKFPIQYNSFGDEAVFDATQMIETGTSDEYARYVTSHGAFIGTPDQKGEACIIYDDNKKVERGMNDREYSDYVHATGKKIKSRVMAEVMPAKGLTDEEIQSEIGNIKSEVRKQVKAELFGWGQFKVYLKDKGLSEDFNIIKESGAIPIPVGKKEVEVGDAKLKLDNEQLMEFNEIAMERYHKYVIKYLRKKDKVAKDKMDYDFEKKKSTFDMEIDEAWADARLDAEDAMYKKLRKQKPAKAEK